MAKDYSTQLIFGLLGLYAMKDYVEQQLVPLQQYLVCVGLCYREKILFMQGLVCVTPHVFAQ
jgi:hypothetical protein